MRITHRVRSSGKLIALLGAVVALAGCGGESGEGGGAGGGAAGGTDYPNGRPVQLVAPSAPGSGWDTTARAMGQVLQQGKLISHPLPIENRDGGTGAVWLSQMVTARKGQSDVIALTSLPIIINKLRGDSDYSYEDVTMVARLITEYFIVVVPADSKYRSLKDLLEAVKANPRSVPVGASGDDRLPMALLVAAAGGDPQKVNFVAYDGGGEQVTALLNGDIQAAVAGVSEFRGQIESGDIRAVGVIRPERLTAPLDTILTAKEQGYDVDLSNARGIYGPPGMSEEAVTYWRDTLKKMIATPAWKSVAAKNQWETTYLEGAEYEQYLAETTTAIETGLKETGEIK